MITDITIWDITIHSILTEESYAVNLYKGEGSDQVNVNTLLVSRHLASPYPAIPDPSECLSLSTLHKNPDFNYYITVAFQ